MLRLDVGFDFGCFCCDVLRWSSSSVLMEVLVFCTVFFVFWGDDGAEEDGVGSDDDEDENNHDDKLDLFFILFIDGEDGTDEDVCGVVGSCLAPFFFPLPLSLEEVVFDDVTDNSSNDEEVIEIDDDDDDSNDNPMEEEPIDWWSKLLGWSRAVVVGV